MDLERINIGDGININFVESDKFKTNLIEIDIINNLESDLKASKNALLAKVLTRGSKNFPTMADINKKLNYLYAAKINSWVSKIGETQVLIISAEMLEDKYAPDKTNITDETINILGDIFINPLTENGSFKTEYVESEKKNLTNEILAQINDKNAYVYKKCIETMCINENFSINNLGTIEAVKSICGNDLYKHYNHILSHCSIEIFCVGKFREKKKSVTEKFVDLLKNIKRENLEKYGSEFISSSDFKGETTEEMEVAQGKLAMGFRTGISNKDNNFSDFVMFDAVYAMTPMGKLFQIIREKLSLCYYCYTKVDSAKGVAVVLCGIENENKQQAADEILNLLNEMKNGDFTGEDIEAARLAVVNSYKEITDSADSIIYWYLRRILCGNIKTPEDALKEINAVTREKIIAAAKKLNLEKVYFLKGTLSKDDNGEENGYDI